MTTPDTAPVLVLTDLPGIEAQAVIGDGLGDYNVSQAGYRDSRPLAVLVRDPDAEETIGGLLGRTSMGLLFIDLFFLPESLRKHGIGARVIRTAEGKRCDAAAAEPSCLRSPSRLPASTSAKAIRCSGGSSASRPDTPGSA